MSTLIIGGLGSMGRRYSAVLSYLREPYYAVDRESSPAAIKSFASRASRILICTPTETHLGIIKRLMTLGKPILCEKPICKNLDDLNELMSSVRHFGTKLNMVMQYTELVSSNGAGDSEYDYFRHGNDGLAWDCLQIIALAKGHLSLREDSPVWKCKINGQTLDLSSMDMAYVNHIRRWIGGGMSQDLNWLYDIHCDVSRISGEINEQSY